MPGRSCYTQSMTTTALKSRDRIASLLSKWETGLIKKYDFYDLTMNYTPKLIAEVTGIEVEVVKDRRRYLRQLEAGA